MAAALPDIVLDHVVNDAERPRTRGRHHTAAHDDVERGGDADQARETLRATGTRHETQRDFRERDARAGGRQSHMAPQRQLQTPAEREAVDGRDDWLLRRLDGVDDGRKVRRAGWR